MVKAVFPEELKSKIETHFPGVIITTYMAYDFPVFEITRTGLKELFRYLRDEEGFIYLTTCCGIHFPGEGEREFGMIYHIHDLVKNRRVRFKTFFPREDLTLPSIVEIWNSANWMERETYDFYGFNFVGHPNLRRILNMDEMNYFPMRKEYPLEDLQREDKDDKMFGR
jgi:NADH-quinone oxidoreductase subunit C